MSNSTGSPTAPFVSRSAYFDVGGFASGPDEDLPFSRRLGRANAAATCPVALVETPGRRVERDEILGTLGHSVALEYRRLFQSRN